MRKFIATAGFVVVLGLLLTTACAPAQEAKSAREDVPPIPAPMAPARSEALAVYRGGGAEALPAVSEERMIVRNGNISLVVKDVVDARDKTAQLAANLDGYVVSSWISGEQQEMRGSVSFRVPDEKFEQALDELRKLAIRVESESTNSQDVTQEYVDLKARLKNAEATESQYLALLDKAKNVDEILRIYDSLSRIRQEIEQIKGQMQYLERTSSMSLITVSLQPAATAKPLVPVGWSALETLKAAVRGLATFGKWLANVAIWLLIFLPIWGTIVGIIYWRLRRRKKAQ